MGTQEETKHRKFACFSMGVGIGGGGRVVVKILAWKLWKLGLIDMVTTDVTTTGQAIIILGSNAVIVHVTPFDPFYFSFKQCGDQL